MEWVLPFCFFLGVSFLFSEMFFNFVAHGLRKWFVHDILRKRIFALF